MPYLSQLMKTDTNAINVFEAMPDDISEEVYTSLFSSKKLRIERIVSNGQSSPEDFWYDQEEHEWVLLLSGKATLAFEDGSILALEAGDHINIPAHTQHRVTETCENTVWLAVFYR